uniref:Uncharacterized protein n=1 Tax=Solanum tuberosum TaxID=4113 RepID=M1BYT3_SOLTU
MERSLIHRDRSSPSLRKGRSSNEKGEKDDSEREKKGNPFMAAYLRTFKNSCDSLASINAPVSQSDMFTFLLAGLPSDYEIFIITAKLQRPKPTMAELRSSLLLHESWLQQMHHITMMMILYTNRVRSRPKTQDPQFWIDPLDLEAIVKGHLEPKEFDPSALGEVLKSLFTERHNSPFYEDVKTAQADHFRGFLNKSSKPEWKCKKGLTLILNGNISRKGPPS